VILCIILLDEEGSMNQYESIQRSMLDEACANFEKTYNVTKDRNNKGPRIEKKGKTLYIKVGK